MGKGSTPGKFKVEKIDKISELPKDEYIEVKNYFLSLVQQMEKKILEREDR